jgi:glycosyltransferase involved in cell wall biosynthesis
MFSIIIPLYNKSNYISRAIRSVFEQSYKNWEIIVVDDGSTDSGYEVVDSIKSEKITLVTQKNSGVSVSRNNGIKIAKYPYIAFLDADDYWHQEYLLNVHKGIFDFPQAGIWTSGFAHSREELRVDSGKFELDHFFFQEAIWSTKFFTSSVVMKREFFEIQPGFKYYLKRGEDLDVWFRAICFFGKIAHCPDKLVLYERGDATGATKIQPHLKYSILAYILNEDYLPLNSFCSEKNSNFHVFKNKYVYLNIYKYFSNSDNHELLRDIINKLNLVPYPLKITYRIPFFLLSWILRKKRGKRFFKNFSIFCLKNFS